MSKHIRVPSTTVELIQILGEILRNHLGLSVHRTECWTFRHVSSWETMRSDFDYPVVDQRNSLYMGEGSCAASGEQLGSRSYQKLDLRAQCHYNNWESAGSMMWEIHMWIQLPDGSILSRPYRCFLGSGSDRDIDHDPKLKIKTHPPKRIGFNLVETRS